MKLSIMFPSKSTIDQFLGRESLKDFSYPEVGASRGENLPGYDNDHQSIYIGEGAVVWSAAKAILNSWAHFPDSWTKAIPEEKPLDVGQNIAVLFRLLGVWFTNSARIVYVLDEADRYGFAYGTLPAHVEQGEECFWIERATDGKIYYHIGAFSKPRFWLARLGYPLARRYQRKFVRESMAKVAQLTARAVSNNFFTTTKK